jgi:hypothetical protein
MLWADPDVTRQHGLRASVPTLDDYAVKTFSHLYSTCVGCFKQTPFGVPLCPDCQKKDGFEWHKMLNGT